MTVEETLFQLKLHGWCLIENVIPESKVRGVRRSIEATAGGYARGGESIDIPDVLNVDQSFAPYLAHEAILGCSGRCGGGWHRIRTCRRARRSGSVSGRRRG